MHSTAYRKEMEENKWPVGEDDEELFELAMHDRQYRDYKSGVAKTRFLKEVEDRKAEMSKAARQRCPEKNCSSPRRTAQYLYIPEQRLHTGLRRNLITGEEVKKGEIMMYLMISKTSGRWSQTATEK